MSRPLLIVSGREPHTALATAIQRGLAKQCREHRLDSLWIPDLCHLSESSKLWKKLAGHAGKAVLLCWIHPRPALWLLRRHEIANKELTILNLSSFPDADSAINAAMTAMQAASRKAKTDAVSPGKTQRCKETVGERWYPVMDGSRCINCQHCLQFCLFGVYELNADGQVEVRNPDQCKPGCPACSRICPQSAIMFPLYEKDAAIAGAPGQFVALDAAARKMFYSRTKQVCPMCGAKAEGKKTKAVGALCPECGRPRPAQTPITGEAATMDRAAFDDLDALVDRLDQRMQRKR